jgi:hypothetical protein
VRDCRGAAFVFIDFWGNENELFHRVFISRENDPEKVSFRQAGRFVSLHLGPASAGVRASRLG